jgi:hypothetical protein
MEDRTLLASFLVASVADNGPGSLRQAILDSNAATGQTNTITFSIPGTGIHTITPLASLPAITQAVVVDGFSQPGYAGTPLIEVSGQSVSSGDGLTIIASGSTIRGLAIGEFVFGAGIVLAGETASGNQIVDNVIGSDASGSEPRANAYGIQIVFGAHDNVIGGTGLALGNLIAGNLDAGLVITGDASVNNRLSGNRIFDNGPSGLSFDGQGSHVVIPDDPGLRFIENSTSAAHANFTVAALVDITSLPDHWSAIVAKSRSAAPWYGLWISDGNQWVGGGPSNVFGPQVTLGEHFVAMTQDLSTSYRSLFVDGVLVATTYVQDASGPGDLWIGGSESVSEFFPGIINSVAIWSAALSQQQLRAAMAGDLTGTESALQAYYRFGAGASATVQDLSPNHRDGVLASANGSSPPVPAHFERAIDLGGDGLTDNAGSPRSGPNNLQNTPVFATNSSGQVQGWLGGSLPNSSYRIEMFASAALASDGGGQAEAYLGALDVTTDASGAASLDVPFELPADKPMLTATATDASGNTSEISGLRHSTLEVPAQPARRVPGDPVIFTASAGDAVVIHDDPAGPLDPTWDLVLQVSDGSLSLEQTDGLSGTGDGTGALEFHGTIADLNAGLDGLRFDRPADRRGPVTLAISASSPGARSLLGRVSILDGVFYVTTTADSGPGSLRQAILDADSTPWSDSIRFAIPGIGAQTIAVLSALPAITGSFAIDGTTQPGFSGTPLIAISGDDVPTVDALTITRSGATVRGLSIGGFLSGAEVVIAGPSASENSIQGNVFGTDPTGTENEPNFFGVQIRDGAHDNVIGGTDPADANTDHCRSLGRIRQRLCELGAGGRFRQWRRE